MTNEERIDRLEQENRELLTYIYRILPFIHDPKTGERAWPVYNELADKIRDKLEKP